ncbi:MAG: hypothetical protein CVV22_05915 [Ignavibacteriae bacterium HGW-Ignavibacteriae-1]|jgi:hypothetical protein|nr:MAG: hypothetical protein CVV22_05915 [Ignavibacteriae bacterium HGW-Ignavibacteriae-1]
MIDNDEQVFDQLIDKMLKEPLSFSDAELDKLISHGLNFNDLRDCLTRIYDLNDEQLSTESISNTGLLGILNRSSNKARKSKYYKRIESQNRGVNYKHIFAEGDSWFQFPYFVKDVVDWLNDRDDYLIYCESSAGDWFTNILYESRIVPALSTYGSAYFLISGGGNDLVGSDRIACMVSTKPQPLRYTISSQIADPTITDDQRKIVIDAQPFITKEFYAYLWVIKAQYKILFGNLYAENNKHKNVISITHGYDYAIPSNRLGFDFKYPYQPIVNHLIQSGKWLFNPMMIKGIKNRYAQKAIMFTFIYEFNQIFIDLAKEFENVYHIDCRGVAESRDDWFDEMHLKDHAYRKIAKAYQYIIDGKNVNCDKVVWAKEFKGDDL